MAKIIAKTGLVQNSNLFLHIADKGGSDVTIADVDGTEFTATSAAAIDWTATDAADVNGVINRGIVVGDSVTFSHMDNVANEGLIGTVTAVTTLVLTCDKTSAHTVTAESNGTNINVIATKKTYQFTEVGDMSFIDGCQGIVLASKLVDMWDALDLDKYSRPFASIEPRAKSLASLNGWEPHDQSTIDAIRDTALEIRSTATATANKIYALWRSGDSDAAGDQFNFWPSSDAPIDAPTAVVMTGYMNQLFLIYDAAGSDNRNTNGGITWFTRCAEPYKTIVMEEHTVNYAEIMPVSAANTADPKLVATDVTISGGGIYANIDWTDATTDYSGDVNGSPYDFEGVIEGDSQTNQTVHEKINYLWRQPTDINESADEVLRGDKQWPLTSFSGEVFTILDGYLANYSAAQRNDLRVTDITPAILQWPSVMTLTVTAPTLAVGGTFTIYHSNTYGTDAAFVFQNESDVNQQDITIAASVSIIMAYSTYALDGHTANTPLPVTIAYNKPGAIEPDVVTAILAGSNLTAAISPTADPSYIV